MKIVKQNYTYVLKSIKKDRTLTPYWNSLTNKTFIVSGGTRGVGFEIARNLALNGANVTIVGKTVSKHPKLERTIYSAAEEICDITQKPNCMAVPCDVRDSKQIDNAIAETLDVYGKGIYGAVLNASALCLNNTLNQTEKEVDLMTQVNINGTYLFGQKCLRQMKDNERGQLLLIAPPIEMLYTDEWWVNHLYYSMSKFNMTLMAKYWGKEFSNIGVNTLWPRTTLNTAPVRNILGGDDMVKISRTPRIMGDAAGVIFKSDPLICNGNNYIDDEVLASVDEDVEKYRVSKELQEKDLMPDFFC